MKPVNKFYDYQTDTLLYTVPDSQLTPKEIDEFGKPNYDETFVWRPGQETFLDKYNDSVKFYGKKVIGQGEDNYLLPVLMIEEKLTLKDGKITQRQPLYYSFGSDFNDGKRTLFIYKVKAADMEPYLKEYEKGRASALNEIFRHTRFGATNLTEGTENEKYALNPLEYPYEPILFYTALNRSDVFSHYLEINGKTVTHQSAMLAALGAEGNPLRLTRPNVKDKPGYIVIRLRSADLLADNPKLQTDEELNVVFQGMFGKGKKYSDYKKFFIKNKGYVKPYIEYILQGVSSGKLTAFSPDTLVNVIEPQIALKILNNFYKRNSMQGNISFSSLEQANRTGKFAKWVDLIAVLKLQNRNIRIDTTQDYYAIVGLTRDGFDIPFISVKNPPLVIGRPFIGSGVLFPTRIGRMELQSFKQSAMYMKSLKLFPKLDTL